MESPQDLQLKLDVEHGLVIGVHKYSEVEIPLDPSALPMHIAVVGATGTGKSRLVKALVDEILLKTNYSVIIFDHTGMDYVPYFKNRVIEASRIVLDPLLITDLMLERTGLDKRTYEPYILLGTLKYMLCKVNPGMARQISFSHIMSSMDTYQLMEEVASKAITWDIREFRSTVASIVDQLKGRDSAKIRLTMSIDVRLGESFFKMLSNRDLLPAHVVDEVFRHRIVVLDLSTEDIMVRRYVVASILSEVWKRIESSRAPVNLVAVIDEAHNYACRYCGEPHKEVSRVAREGRKWGFGLVLATQRMVDIDPEIRGNINTVIFSKLQTPSDFNEISAYMDLGGLTEASLAALGRREFFVAGLMNILKVPILIRVKEVPSPGI